MIPYLLTAILLNKTDLLAEDIQDIEVYNTTPNDIGDFVFIDHSRDYNEGILGLKYLKKSNGQYIVQVFLKKDTSKPTITDPALNEITKILQGSDLFATVSEFNPGRLQNLAVELLAWKNDKFIL